MERKDVIKEMTGRANDYIRNNIDLTQNDMALYVAKHDYIMDTLVGYMLANGLFYDKDITESGSPDDRFYDEMHDFVCSIVDTLDNMRENCIKTNKELEA